MKCEQEIKTARMYVCPFDSWGLRVCVLWALRAETRPSCVLWAS